MTSIGNLPAELIEHILVRVPLLDLFHNVRLVCKGWNNLIENCNLELDELIIFLNQIPKISCYCNSTAAINLDNAIRSKNLNFFQLSSFRAQFRKLRRLLIYCPEANDPGHRHEFDIKLLNCFTKLEHIEFFNLDLKRTDHIINFFNLKVFSYKPSVSFNIMKVICPQLKCFRTYGEQRLFNPNNRLIRNYFHFYYLDRIKYVEVDSFHSTIGNFKNLEILKVNEIVSIDTKFLAALRNLKEILFFSNDNLFEELHKQKRNYKLPDLQIYLLGINFESKPYLIKIVDRYSLNEHNLDLYISHYDLLADRIPFIERLDYDALKSCCSPRDLPPNFFQIFSSIKSITVNKKVDEPYEFIQFLSSIKCLNKLSLINANLEQFFYNKLPHVCKHLNKLTVEEDRDRLLDFGFLTAYAYMTDIKLNQYVSLELAHQILLSCKHLKSFLFVYDDQKISILKRNSTCYESSAFNKNLLHNCLNTLIKFLKANQEV